ncbi:MAG: D-alanyl-D-alanine carboxypeptidase/D-alanyl-D-alanine endopeptidase, partial [Saprospiraceae bacterium]
GEFTVKGSLPDPAFTAAMLLLTSLEKEGIKTQRIASTSRIEKDYEKKRQTIHIHSSAPLIDIIRVTNEDSNNLFCEAILKAIGKTQKNDSSTTGGIEAVEEFWKKKGLNLEGFFMNDGSGLSPKNALTSSHFTKILTIIHKEKQIHNLFKSTLPISGKTGTMKYMFRGTSAQGKIFAKTGSMTRVRSYTGYIDSSKGKKLAFSIIVNNYEGKSSDMREKLKKLMSAIHQS